MKWKKSPNSMKVLQPKIYPTHERISLISAENRENKQNEKEECKLLEMLLRHGMTERLERMTCDENNHLLVQFETLQSLS